MARKLILVRHPSVAKAWSGRCYGQSDMGLSREGEAMLAPLIEQLAAMKPDHVIHSGLRRARMVGEPLASRLGIPAITAPAWQERHFGAWEGRSWQAIYRQTGNIMDGMIDAPDSFRPGSIGETTADLIARITQALTVLPQTGNVAVITHGGPIAAVRHLQAGTPIAEMASHIIPPGNFVIVES